MSPLERSLTSAGDDCDPTRLAHVMSALDLVFDPELDEPITSMGFIEAVTLRGRRVDITFRLPTFWCSANFAYLMASDMREAVERLGFVDEACVRLVDHFAARRINQGVAAGLGFAATFVGEAESNLDDIRRAFRERAFLGRQERLLQQLAEHSWSVEAMLALDVADLESLCAHDDPEIGGAATSYLAIRRHEGGSAEASDPAFIMLAGAPIRPEMCAAHRRNSRRICSTAAANAEMCRIQLQARLSHPAPGCEPGQRKDEGDHE
jgi:metal-sulfur cluster biosynthetic enzyme